MRGARVQEEGELDFGCEEQLGGEVLELCFFGAERETVVIESYFSECDGVGGGLGFECEGA